MKNKFLQPMLLGVVAAAYFAAGLVGLALASSYKLATPGWPPTGLALAAVLLLGRRIWPGIFLGALLINLAALTRSGGNLAGMTLVSLVVAGGNTLEALTGAWLVGRFARGPRVFWQPQTTLLFVLAAVVSTAIAASVGMAAMTLGGVEHGQVAGQLWFRWWLGDLTRALVVAPPILLWSMGPRPRLGLKRLGEAAALVVLLVLFCGLVFSGWRALHAPRTQLLLLVIPVLIWTALRFGQRGTASVTLVLASLATFGTLRGYGPFAGPNLNTNLLILQNVIILCGVMSLILAADVAQRQRIEAGLRASERRYRALSELGRRLSAARTAKDAADIIMATADSLFAWDVCTLNLCSPDPNSMETVCCVDTLGGQRTEIALTSSQPGPLTFRALAEGAQLILRPSPVTFGPEARPFGDTTRPSASLMFVPLRKEGQGIGVLSLQSYTPQAYTEADLEVLQVLADHCGGALDRIRAGQEIDRLNRELRHRVEELQLLFDVAPVGIAVAHDPQCLLITTNPAGAGLLETNGMRNISRSGPNANRFGHRIMRDGREVPPQELPMQRAASQGRPVRDEELDLVFSDGRVVNSFISAAPLYDEAGRVRGSLGVFVDVTARKHAEREILLLNTELERRVQQRTAQLEAINQELESFSYSVSHDLRAPLRSIRGFSEVLLQRYASRLDARGQEFLRRTCESSVQMYQLIEDLLALSRVGRSELHRQTVKLSALANAIALGLCQAEPKRAVKCIITPGLEARGDEALLRITLENLLRNAWKFTSNQAKPRIEFGVSPGPVPTYFVRDNGAGFDMAHASRLFGVFQRLHSEREFPGTGVGLATVQRIINRHGGRAWAEGAVNQGATFYFTLPAQED